jgi:hypothetical protein
MPSVPLCQHLNVSGKSCGSPAQRHRRFCYFHDESRKRARVSAQRQRNIYPKSNFLQFPVLEDANAIQVALMQTIDGLLDGRLTDRQTGLLLYALQTASANLKRVTLEAEKPEQPQPWVGELLTALRAIPNPDDVVVGAGDPPAQVNSDTASVAASASPAPVSKARPSTLIPNIQASAKPPCPQLSRFAQGPSVPQCLCGESVFDAYANRKRLRKFSAVCSPTSSRMIPRNLSDRSVPHICALFADVGTTGNLLA